MGKFGSLVPEFSETFKVELVDQFDNPIIDKAGKRAVIEVYSADGKAGRAYDKERRKADIQRARSGDTEPADQFEANIDKCAALTASWYLVDVTTREPLDVPCNRENAKELYSADNMLWLFVQPWNGSTKTANFTKRPSKSSLNTGEPSGETAAS